MNQPPNFVEFDAKILRSPRKGIWFLVLLCPYFTQKIIFEKLTFFCSLMCFLGMYTINGVEFLSKQQQKDIN